MTGFVAFREGFGMEVLPASGGTPRFAILAQPCGPARLSALIL